MVGRAENSKSYNFKLKIQEAKIFKNAISVLTEPDFNPNFAARFEVSRTGASCMITVQKTGAPYWRNQIVYAVLNLQATGLAEFECIHPFRRTVNLSPLSESLAHVADNAVVTVYHLFNTPDKLYFEFGSEPNNNPIELTLHDDSLGPLKFLDISWESKTVVAFKDLKAMVDRIVNLAPEDRPASVTVNDASFEAGTFEIEAKTDGGPFLFMWRYWGMLQKALSSAEECCICLIANPDKTESSVVVQFNFRDIGDLRLLQGGIALHGD